MPGQLNTWLVGAWLGCPLVVHSSIRPTLPVESSNVGLVQTACARGWKAPRHVGWIGLVGGGPSPCLLPLTPTHREVQCSPALCSTLLQFLKCAARYAGAHSCRSSLEDTRHTRCQQATARGPWGMSCKGETGEGDRWLFAFLAMQGSAAAAAPCSQAVWQRTCRRCPGAPLPCSTCQTTPLARTGRAVSWGGRCRPPR